MITDQKVSVDIVLPCYNPPANWEKQCVKSFDLIQKSAPDFSWNLIIVNDGSTAGVEASHIHYIEEHIKPFRFLVHTKNQGKGSALRTGITTAESDLIIYTDIDFPYYEECLVDIANTLSSKDFDIALGYRDQSYYKNVPPFRVRLSKSLRLINKKLLRLPSDDTQCGLKGFKNKVKPLFLETQTERYIFDLEFLFLAGRHPEYKIGKVAARLKENIVFSRINRKILLHECRDFLKIILKRIFSFKK